MRLSRSEFGVRVCLTLILLGLSGTVQAHGVDQGDAHFLSSKTGLHFWPYAYLGAKHMVTGYDHLLFLAGVVFFLTRLRDVGMYVTLFAIGHSLTLLLGVLLNIPANPYLIDAIIGLSVVYKALENLGGLKVIGWRVDTRIAVCAFGLVHGLGLATKLQELSLSEDGLVGNLLAFNLGVEVGQLLALFLILSMLALWRYGLASGTRLEGSTRGAIAANCLIMAAGLVLIGYQLTGFFVYR